MKYKICIHIICKWAERWFYCSLQFWLLENYIIEIFCLKLCYKSTFTNDIANHFLQVLRLSVVLLSLMLSNSRIFFSLLLPKWLSIPNTLETTTVFPYYARFFLEFSYSIDLYRLFIHQRFRTPFSSIVTILNWLYEFISAFYFRMYFNYGRNFIRIFFITKCIFLYISMSIPDPVLIYPNIFGFLHRFPKILLFNDFLLFISIKACYSLGPLNSLKALLCFIDSYAK